MILEVRKGLWFLVVTGLTTALLLEVAVRLVFPSDEPGVPNEIGQFDEQLGWSLKPQSSGTSGRTGYEISYNINSKGLRDDETTYEKPDGVFRVVLLGDSRTFGFGVPIEKHFSTLLEGYVPGLEVINLGVSGFGVDQELLFLRSEGFRYEPDLVIAYVAHYGNHRHMHTTRWGKEKPRLGVVDGTLVVTDLVSPQPARGLVRTVHWGLVDHSRVYALVRWSLLGLLGQRDSTPTEVEVQDLANSQDASFEAQMYDLGLTIISAMHDESQVNGADFLLVTQITSLHEAATERGMLSLDVTKAMSNRGFELPDGLEHINEAGNGVLAWEIVRFLESKAMVPLATP